MLVLWKKWLTAGSFHESCLPFLYNIYLLRDPFEQAERPREFLSFLILQASKKDSKDLISIIFSIPLVFSLHISDSRNIKVRHIKS